MHRSAVMPAKPGIQYAAAYPLKHGVSGILDCPVKPDDDTGEEIKKSIHIDSTEINYKT